MSELKVNTGEVATESERERALSLFEEAGQDPDSDFHATRSTESHKNTEGETTEEPEVKDEEKQQPNESKSEYYARLTKLDRENRELKRQLKTNKSEDLLELAKKDKKAVLEKLGISFEDLLDDFANDSENIDESVNNNSSNQEVDWKKEFQRFQEEQKQQFEQYKGEVERDKRLNQEYSAINDALNSDTDGKWEIVKSRGSEAVERALEWAVAYYNQEGEVPTYQDVFDVLEEDYFNENKEKLESLKGMSKFKSYFEAGEKVAPEAPAPHPTFRRDTTTLGDIPRGTPTPREPSARESWEESRARAIALAESMGEE